MLAMVVNDNACWLNARVVPAFFVGTPPGASSLPQGIGYTCEKLVGWQAAFAGKPAPTMGRRTPTLLTTHQAER